MIQVSIVKGHYRGKVVSGVFDLVKPYVDSPAGGFITIKNPNPDPGTPPVQRIKVEQGEFKLLNSAGEEIPASAVVEPSDKGSGIVVSSNYEQEFLSLETDDEAMERIAETFLMLDKVTDAAANGIIRGLVVSGPPGIGKSYGVEKQLEAANMFRKLEGKDPAYEIISGGVSAIGLYQKLYFNRGSRQVIVFDDCDGVLFDEEQLNLLKAALNSGDRRRICWNKESRVLVTEDIPDAFDFEGSVIFLSNIDFDRSIAKQSRIAQHLAAIMSRCHYLDLEIGSLRDQLLRIKQVVRDGMLMPYEFSAQEEIDIIDFVIDNKEHLREVSLRMVKKIADFVKMDPTGWREIAEATCLQKEAKFKRLLAKKKIDAHRGVELQAV